GSASLMAQTATGSILGTVTDPSGAAVSGVTVTINSATTGSTRTTATSDVGTYSSVGLVPGEYQLTYDAPGFSKGQQNIMVSVGGTANGNFTLKLGAGTTTVQVEAEAAEPVNTVQAVVEDVQTAREIEAIPLNGRNFLDLAQLNAG